MSNILILEPDLNGHKWNYTRYLIDQALIDGHRVTATVLPPQARDLGSRELMELYGNSISYLEAGSPTVTTSMIRSATSPGRHFDSVIVPSGDALVKQLAWSPARSFPIPSDTYLRILVMRPPVRGSLSPIDLTKRFAVRLVAFRSQVSINYLVGPGMETNRALQVPDPVEIAEEFQRLPDDLEELDPDRFWFGMVGTIWPRKNPELVVQALAKASLPSPCGLVIAGQWDPDLWLKVNTFRQTLQRHGSVDFAVINRVLTDGELDAVISWLDCVIVAHSNEGSSGILGKASALGTRVVGSGAKTLQQDLLVTGGIWCPLSVNALSEAMRRVVLTPEPLPRRVASPSDFAKALLYGRHP